MKKRNNKSFLLLASLALIVTAVIGTTMAYLVSDTPAVTNTFTPATVDSRVDEDFDYNVKNDVRIQNTGDIKAYIRAKVVVTWQNDQKQISAEQPKLGEDYQILDINGEVTNTLPADSGWVLRDGFYYWTSKVAPQAYTGYLIGSIKQISENEGYNLHVEILAEAIQAEGMGAISAENAWAIAKGNQTN